MTATTAPATKDDIFGVCRRLGEDFGFHPNILRIALAVGLIWSIEGVFAAYAVLGLIVLLSRVVVPQRRAVATATRAPVGQEEAPFEYAKAA